MISILLNNSQFWLGSFAQTLPTPELKTPNWSFFIPSAEVYVSISSRFWITWLYRQFERLSKF